MRFRTVAASLALVGLAACGVRSAEGLPTTTSPYHETTTSVQASATTEAPTTTTEPVVVVTTTSTVQPTTTLRPVPTTVPEVIPTTVYQEPTYEEPAVEYEPMGTNAFLECVKQHESRGDYTAVNPSSGAGGAYQFLQTTWDNTARYAGRYDLVGIHPSNASPADQDFMAITLYNWQGPSPWTGSGC